MIKVEEFRGCTHDHLTPAMKLEQFLKKEKIARQDIISINYSSEHGPDSVYCSVLLTYEKESK